MALSAPTTNATGAAVAIAPTATSVTTTILDNDTQTFSLTQAGTTVNEGSADTYTVHLSNPIDPGVTVSATIAITLPGGLGGAEAADFSHAFLADIDAAIAATTGVTRSGNTLTFDSTFDTSAGFSFTLPTLNDTLVEGSESYSVALSAPATNATGAAVAIAPTATSVTTTIIDNDTQTFSLTQAGTTVNEGSADTYTVHLSNPIDPGVTVSATIAITLPGGLGGAEAADFSHAFLADIDAAIAATTGVTRSGNTLTFDSTFDTSAGFSFTLPTLNDTLVEGSESYSVALSAPATNATGAAVAIAPTATSVTTTILDNDTQTFSLTQAGTTVNEGSADTYTVHLSNPIDPGVTVSATIAITLPGGLGGAEAADFSHAFLADIDAAIAATTGVTRSGNTLTFDSTFDTSGNFSFTLPTFNDTLVEGSESYSVALSAPATNATGAAVAIAPTATSVTTTIIDNDTQTFSLTQTSTTVNEGSADSYTVHLSNPIDPGVTVSATIAITLPGGLGGAEAADFTHAFLADIDAAIAATTGVTRSGNTLTFDSTFDTSAGFSFTLPTLNDTLVEGSETYSVALSAPTTNATGAAVAIAPAATSVTTTIIDNDTQTFSLTQAGTTVNEGSADTYTVHLSNPIDPGVTVSATIAITLPGGLGGAEAADFSHAFLADIDAAIAATTGVTRSGNTLTFDSTFDTSAGFSFTLPTLNDTLVEGNETYSVALSAPTTNATGAAVALAPAATSVTTTIIDNDTQTFSLTQTSTTVNEGSADSYTVHLSNPIDPGVTVSVNIAITLPGGLGGAEAADFSHAFLADIDAAIAATTGVTRSGNTLTFNLTFDTSGDFSFTLPTFNDTLVEGSESYSVALSAPATNATGAAVAIAPTATSVTTTIIDNDTQTFSLTQAGTTVNEGSADTYTVHLSNPIDPGVTVSATIAITLPGGLGGAEAADFTHAFLADIDAAIAATTGVIRSGNTLTFDSTFDTSAGFSFTLPTLNDTLVEGSESYSVALSAPATNATGAAVAIAPTATSVTTTIIDNDTQTFSLTQAGTTVNEGSADTYTVHLSNPIDPGVTVSATIAITLPGGLGGAEAADFTHAFLADIDAAIAATTGVTRSGNTLTFDSTFAPAPASASPCRPSTTPWSRAARATAWRCPRRPPTPPAPRSRSLPPPPASPPPSSTTTPRPSRSPKPAPPSTRAAPTPTPSISPTRSIPASPSAPPSPSPCRAGSAAPRRRISAMPSWPTLMPRSPRRPGSPAPATR